MLISQFFYPLLFQGCNPSVLYNSVFNIISLLIMKRVTWNESQKSVLIGHSSSQREGSCTSEKCNPLTFQWLREWVWTCFEYLHLLFGAAAALGTALSWPNSSVAPLPRQHAADSRTPDRQSPRSPEQEPGGGCRSWTGCSSLSANSYCHSRLLIMLFIWTINIESI